MQIVSSGWAGNVAKTHRRIGHGVLISWLRTTSSGTKFFTINQSSIGGPDIIKGGGSAVTFFDKYYLPDYSRYLVGLSVARKLGQYPYGTIMAQADVELDNSDRTFLPNYSPTIGSGILPNRPMKLSIGIDDEYLKLFVGFTGMPNNTLLKRKTLLHAFDAFDYINGYKSSFSGAMVNAPFQNVVASGLKEMGFSTSQSVIDPSLQQRIGYLSPYGRKWGDIFKEGCEAEQALMFVDENGIIRFWNRQHFTTLSGTSQFALNYSKLGDIQWQNTPVINSVVVRAKPRAVAANQKIWETAGAIELAASADTEYFISFRDDDGDLPTTSVDIPKYISDTTATSKYATNENSDGTGNTRSGSITVVTAYSFGNTYKLVFRNAHTNSVYLTQLEIWARPAKVTNTIEEIYEDASSVEIFGRNPSNNGEPLVIENDLIQDKSTAHSLAYTLVKEYKDPRKRYVVPVAVGSNPAWQIGDYGSLTIQDTGETKSVWITGITNSIARNGKYDQVVELEERNIKRYFTINQSKINGTDVIAP